jgi:hypothetical protein
MKQRILDFFAASDVLAYEVLKPLSHMRGNWDPYVDSMTEMYEDEENSFAWLFNQLIHQISQASPPAKYHDSEDRLAEHVQQSLNWGIKKFGNGWLSQSGGRLTPNDYLATLEQGGFKIEGVNDLLDAAAGRISAAIQHGHRHFDEMERGHQIILAGVLAAILYHWAPYEDSMRKIVAEQVAQPDVPASGRHAG